MNESAFCLGAIGGVVREAVTRSLQVAGVAFLMLGLAFSLLLTSARVVSERGAGVSDVSAAEYLDLHFSYLDERVAQVPMTNATCR